MPLRTYGCALWFWARVYAGTSIFVLLSPVFLTAACIAEACLLLSGKRGFSDKLRNFPDEKEIERLENMIISSHFKEPISHLQINVELKVAGVKYKCNGHVIKLLSGFENLPKMILIHGTASSSASFAELFQFLSKSFDIIAVDMPGFGRSNDVSPQFSPGSRTEIVDFYVQYIDEILKAMQLEKVVVLAHSFGGFIAAQYAVRMPRHVSHLILLDGAGILPTLGENGAYWAFIFKKSVLQFGRPLGKLGAWFFFVWFCVFNASADSFYWYSLLSHPLGWGDKCVGQFINLTWTKAWWNSPVIQQVELIQCPVATIYGEEDDIIPPHQGQLLQKIFKFPLTVVQKAGHSPFHGEHAQELSRAVLDWFNGLREDESQEQPTCTAIKIPQLLWGKYASSFSVHETREIIKILYNDISSAQ
jgi:pimeloyl-ACP methyl ester carboxylesterase